MHQMQRFLKTTNPTPVGIDEFRGLFNKLLDKMPSIKDVIEQKKIGIAVSGGYDSVALCMLAKQVIPGDRLIAFMVDHRLNQRGITEDPEKVSSILTRIGIRHEIVPLDWSTIFWDAMTKGKLLEKTRELRYEAIFKACRKHDIPLVLTGHNLDDDIVTMFYRLAHLSGIDGLACMKASTNFPVTSSVASKFFIGHPLLQVPKERLYETCRTWNLEWTDDKSNADLDFRRNSISNLLREAQESNPALSTEAITRTLYNFKRIRSDIHEEIVKVFDKSVIINKVNGDSTLVLNDEGWLKKRWLATRVIMILLQYGAANRYPARTPSTNNLYSDLIKAYNQHKEKQERWFKTLPATLRMDDLQPFDKTRRVDFKQHSLSNCSFYALSRTDALRRIALQERLEGRKIAFGPAFLIQRNPPNSVAQQRPMLHGVEVTLGPGQSFLWDDRVHISFEHLPSLQDPLPSGSRKFIISFMTPGDVKDYEALTRSMPTARRRVYAYLGTTPGTHLYQIPVMREVGTDYMVFPTLKADFPVNKYKWKTTYAGTPNLMSRFLCLP